MRTFLLLWLLLLILPDSTRASVPDSSAVEPIRVVTGRDTIEARCIRPAPFDAVEITTIDYDVRYEPASHVDRVLDQDGVDRTASVVDRRKTIGEPLPKKAKEQRIRAPGKPHFGPRSITRAFIISETTIQGQIAPAPGGLISTNLGGFVGFDLGIMENVSDRLAIGYGVYFGSAPEYANVGVRLRIRRWASPHTAVELAPAIILGENRSNVSEPRSPGFSLQANYTLSRWFTLNTETYYVRHRTYNYGERENVGVLVGAKVGRWPGAIGGLLAGLTALGRMIPASADR